MYVTPRLVGRALQRLRSRYLRLNPLCVACALRGELTAATEVDHIVPLNKGGSYVDRNLQGLCHACHADKSARDADKQRAHGCDAHGVPNDATHHWNAKRI